MSDEGSPEAQLVLKVYDDSLSDGVKELAPGFKAWGMQLNRPVLWTANGLKWLFDGLEKTVERVNARFGPKLEQIPEEHRSEPHPALVKEAVENSLLHDADDALADAFANLLASSLDKRTVLEAHPSFFSVLKELAPDEAVMLRGFSTSGPTLYYPVVRLLSRSLSGGLSHSVSVFGGYAQEAACKYPDLEPEYLENLVRLGLAFREFGSHVEKNSDKYASIRSSDFIKRERERIERGGFSAIVEEGYFRLTDRGMRLCRAAFRLGPK